MYLGFIWFIWYESTDKRKPIDLLLELGADPDIKDNYGYTPLRYAVKRDMELGGGFEDIYQFMLSKTELNSTDNSKLKTHIHCICIISYTVYYTVYEIMHMLCIYWAFFRGTDNIAPSSRSSKKQGSTHTAHSQRQGIRWHRCNN